MLGMISGGLSIISGIKGLFGKKKDTSPRANMLSQAAGAREAAEKYGFNPLTMLQYGQTGAGLADSSVPPLASIELIREGLSGFDPRAREEAERQRQADILNLDLARLKLEQARSGVIVGPMGATDSVGRGPSPLGRRAAMAVPGGSISGAGNARYPVRLHSGGADGVRVGGDSRRVAASDGKPDAVIPAKAAHEKIAAYADAGLPAFRLFGFDLLGSGATSSGQVMEDAGGEVLGGLGGLFAVTDAVGATIGRAIDKRRMAAARARGERAYSVEGQLFKQMPDKAKRVSRKRTSDFFELPPYVSIPGVHVRVR